jgi:hypothetical protein
MKPASTTLREFLARDEILVLPGVYDGISARVALGEGFDALYMTGMYGPFVPTFFVDLPALVLAYLPGAGTSASVLGQPDLGVRSCPLPNGWR